jgi:hypothetical protein
MQQYSGYVEKAGIGGGIYLVKRGYACRAVEDGGWTLRTLK